MRNLDLQFCGHRILCFQIRLRSQNRPAGIFVTNTKWLSGTQTVPKGSTVLQPHSSARNNEIEFGWNAFKPKGKISKGVADSERLNRSEIINL